VPDRRLQVEQPQLEQGGQRLSQVAADVGVELVELVLKPVGRGRGVAVAVAEGFVYCLDKMDHRVGGRRGSFAGRGAVEGRREDDPWAGFDGGWKDRAQ